MIHLHQRRSSHYTCYSRPSILPALVNAVKELDGDLFPSPGLPSFSQALSFRSFAYNFFIHPACRVRLLNWC